MKTLPVFFCITQTSHKICGRNLWLAEFDIRERGGGCVGHPPQSRPPPPNSARKMTDFFGQSARLKTFGKKILLLPPPKAATPNKPWTQTKHLNPFHFCTYAEMLEAPPTVPVPSNTRVTKLQPNKTRVYMGGGLSMMRLMV